MNDKYITEIMDEVENMPEWMQEAFRTGRVYHTCVKRVAELELKVMHLRAAITLEAAFLRACVEQWQGDYIPLGRADLIVTVERLEQVLEP